jgi:hypothetical protein
MGLREAKVPTPSLLPVDRRFSIARPYLHSIFNRKSPVEITENMSGILLGDSGFLGHDAVDSRHRAKTFRFMKPRRETIFYSGLRVLTQFPTQL